MAQVIGEGSYGCVHKPQLLCRYKTVRKPNKISKLMTTANARTELGEYKTIDNIDPSNEYYLGKPATCYPDAKLQNMKDIRKCAEIGPAVLQSFADPSMFDDYTLLIMEDGGMDLKKYGEMLDTLSVNEDNIEKVEKFWLEAHRIFLGLKTFLDNDVVHHDMKHPNIVYNETTNRIAFIDFGLMTKKSKIIGDCKHNMYGLGQFHWSFPWELYYLNRPQHLNIAAANEAIKKLSNNYRTSINKYVNDYSSFTKDQSLSDYVKKNGGLKKAGGKNGGEKKTGGEKYLIGICLLVFLLPTLIFLFLLFLTIIP